MQYQIEFTLDGSPTLRLFDGHKWSEAMHSPKGAFSESLYIYSQAMEVCRRRGWDLKVLSIGLGLGYNELLFAAHYSMLSPAQKSHALLESYESELFLRETFLNWCLAKEPSSDKNSELHNVYSIISSLVAEQFATPQEALRLILCEMYLAKKWQIHGAFTENTQTTSPMSCICFDAFSSKTTPSLWQEQCLDNILRNFCADNCIFATYAATGALTRKLLNAGFREPKRAGFSGKRESTFAERSQKSIAL